MITQVSAINISYKSYRQQFTNEEFQKRVAETIVDSAKNSKFIKLFKLDPQKQADKSLKTLEKYKQVFKDHNFLSQVNLSIKDNELVGKITYLTTSSMEIKTLLSNNLKKFLKKISKVEKLQTLEDELNKNLWEVIAEEKYIIACCEKRYQELTTGSSKTPNPLVLYYDFRYLDLLEKQKELVQKRENLTVELTDVRKKLHKLK